MAKVRRWLLVIFLITTLVSVFPASAASAETGCYPNVGIKLALNTTLYGNLCRDRGQMDVYAFDFGMLEGMTYRINMVGLDFGSGGHPRLEVWAHPGGYRIEKFSHTATCNACFADVYLTPERNMSYVLRVGSGTDSPPLGKYWVNVTRVS